MGQHTSKSQTKTNTKQVTPAESHPALTPAGGNVSYLDGNESSLSEFIAQQIGRHLSSYNNRASLWATSKWNASAQAADLNKINQILVADQFEQPDIHPLTPHEIDLIQTLQALCQAIMEYGQAWLQEYDYFKESGYKAWSHSALDTRKSSARFCERSILHYIFGGVNFRG